MSEKIKEYPIPFTAPMVKAILDDKKTQTRRLVKLKEGETIDVSTCWAVHPLQGSRLLRCPYGKKGERLWVRETFLHATYVSFTESGDHQMSRANLVEYVADGALPRYLYPGVGGSPYMQKRPSIFMPRWASRLLLDNLGVRIERVQDITEEDAIAEGMTPPENLGAWERAQHWEAREAFRVLWESINGPESWALNPWVWVISFRRIQEGGK